MYWIPEASKTWWALVTAFIVVKRLVGKQCCLPHLRYKPERFTFSLKSFWIGNDEVSTTGDGDGWIVKDSDATAPTFTTDKWQ